MAPVNMESVVRGRVRDIVKENYYFCDELEDNSDMYYEGFDSIDMIDILMKVEKEFSVEIPNSELESLRSIDDFVKAVMKRIG